MSSKKTKNLNLHQWEKTDIFSRTEFNENFAKIDETCGALAKSIADTRSQIPRIVSGTYTGNGGTIQINLGFRPEFVLILLGHSYYSQVRAGASGFGSAITVTDTGFKVAYDQNTRANEQGKINFYVAFL